LFFFSFISSRNGLIFALEEWLNDLHHAVHRGRSAREWTLMSIAPSRSAASAAAAASDSWSRHVRRVTANWPPFLSGRGTVSLFLFRGRSVPVLLVLSCGLHRVQLELREPWSFIEGLVKNADFSVSRTAYIVSGRRPFF